MLKDCGTHQVTSTQWSIGQKVQSSSMPPNSYCMLHKTPHDRNFACPRRRVSQDSGAWCQAVHLAPADALDGDLRYQAQLPTITSFTLTGSSSSFQTQSQLPEWLLRCVFLRSWFYKMRLSDFSLQWNPQLYYFRVMCIEQSHR